MLLHLPTPKPYKFHRIPPPCSFPFLQTLAAKRSRFGSRHWRRTAELEPEVSERPLLYLLPLSYSPWSTMPPHPFPPLAEPRDAEISRQSTPPPGRSSCLPPPFWEAQAATEDTIGTAVFRLTLSDMLPLSGVAGATAPTATEPPAATVLRHRWVPGEQISSIHFLYDPMASRADPTEGVPTNHTAPRHPAFSEKSEFSF
jgi:hypothetical protein